MSAVEVTGDEVVVRWALFRLRAPRSLVAGARLVRRSRLAGFGVHWWRGAWVVSTLPLQRAGVEVTFAEPVRGRLFGVPLRVRRLQLVVDRPETLVAQLS